MIARIMRVFKLDSSVFREIAEDKAAMTQAAIIVVVVSLFSALGMAISAVITETGSAIGSFFVTLLSGILLGWILWAILTYAVGVFLFKGKTDIPEMMRVLGYANAPNLLGILVIIPCLGWIAALVGWVLSLIAGVIAVREAMEFDTVKAVITVLIAWVISFGIQWIIGGIF
jgi:hypothetical protein